MKKHVPLLVAGTLFLLLVWGSQQALEGAKQGLALCGATLAPSLFPFFALANLLSELGLPDLLGQRLSPLMKRLFRISGSGAQAFLLGICGGYPLGASVVAELRRKEYISRPEAERLLAFCNNSGPAFILGAAGVVFSSPRAGLLLYITHILGAVCVGLVFRGPQPEDGPGIPAAPTREPARFFQAFPRCITRALGSVLTVCAYVVLFSSLLALWQPAVTLPGPLGALMTGFWELSGGIASLKGLPPTPENLAAAALLLGWGGVSVHFQTMGVVSDTDIKCARHLAGRALCGIFAGILTFLLAALWFQ